MVNIRMRTNVEKDLYNVKKIIMLEDEAGRMSKANLLGARQLTDALDEVERLTERNKTLAHDWALAKSLADDRLAEVERLKKLLSAAGLEVCRCDGHGCPMCAYHGVMKTETRR